MVLAMMQSEGAQLTVIRKCHINSRLDLSLQAHDRTSFAREFIQSMVQNLARCRRIHIPENSRSSATHFFLVVFKKFGSTPMWGFV